MRTFRRTRSVWAALFLAGAIVIPMASPAAAATLTDGDSYGPWQVVFAGYGDVTATSTSKLRLRPAAPTNPSETHAALVVTKTVYTSTRVKARVTTNAQLRTGSEPNPWETGWLVARYQDNEHFYYAALKTNGWELGKRDPAFPGGQRFLTSGSTPNARVGQAQVVVLTAKGSKLTLRINGDVVASFTDTATPYSSGAAGLYTEDADVTFDQIAITS